ncbi:A/G-specific adenine glycosylase [Candidatus Marinamargulisbacteria bacterium SCGC AAA071-K20]|nr:A/G-specific adenine glycosylase [Candidatus Marinamargulisbacteria bacterium SCGC AAA071-K20]
MPWRDNPSPYFTLVSEIMLQQTQVATVIPYFNRFIEKFPTVYDLADADEQVVLKAWEGLGYYSRARNLQKAAKMVVQDFNGKLPSTYDDLQKLPGIGPYCAAAITSIAFGNAVPVVDGNVLRVFTRFWGVFDDIRNTKVRDVFFNKLKPYVAEDNPSDFNQAIMECGALICKPKSPLCEQCPLSKDCFAFNSKKTEDLPVKSKLKPVPHYNIAVAVIQKDGKILIGKRDEKQMLGGLWEFPGGKQESKESLEETCLREVKEETGLQIEILNPLTSVKHAYSHFKITLHPFLCDYVSGKEIPKSATELKWVSLNDLSKYPFPKANKVVLESLYT